MGDKPEILNEQEKSVQKHCWFRYLCQERYDVAFTVKELASRMSNPTTMSFHHLKKFLGYLKKTVDYFLVIKFLHAGEGCVKKSEHYWRLETFSDSDCSGNKAIEGQHQEDSMH